MSLTEIFSSWLSEPDQQISYFQKDFLNAATFWWQQKVLEKYFEVYSVSNEDKKYIISWIKEICPRITKEEVAFIKEIYPQADIESSQLNSKTNNSILHTKQTMNDMLFGYHGQW